MLSVIHEEDKEHTDVSIAEEQEPQNVLDQITLICLAAAEDQIAAGEFATSVIASEVEPEEETSPQRCCFVS